MSCIKLTFLLKRKNCTEYPFIFAFPVWHIGGHTDAGTSDHAATIPQLVSYCYPARTNEVGAAFITCWYQFFFLFNLAHMPAYNQFTVHSPTLWTTFLAMMLLKANSYALNNPTKEMLYLPTSSKIKYKAKSWIDIFGARGSKALGSCVTSYFSYSTVSLVSNGSIVGVCVSAFLIWNAIYMGKKFEGYVSDGVIVGEEEEGSHDVIPQKLDPLNEEEGTSCAVDEDEDEDEEEAV